MVESEISETIQRRYYRIGRDWGEKNYDSAAGLVRAGSGRHSTRESLYFARVLLDSRDDAEIGRAAGLIEGALAGQVTREGSAVRGNFPRCVEDTEEAIWDPNWACFNTQTLLELLAWHGVRLPKNVVARMESALELAAEHDLARWVSPAYSNIAMLTALGLAGTGARLRDRRLSWAGREKLEEVALCVKATGAFEEYNSPAYAAVNLRAIASWLMLVDEDDAAARELWRRQWAAALDRAHAATGQLAGPHGRAYGRDLLRNARGAIKFYLHRALPSGFPLGEIEDGSPDMLFPALMVQDPDCPDDLKKRWGTLPVPRTVVATVDSCSGSVGLPAFRVHPPYWRAKGTREAWAELIRSKGEPGSRSFRGQVQRTTTWLDERFCLGTVSADAMQDQAAPLIAHWPSAEGSGRADYVVALGLSEEGGSLKYLPGAVLCLAQNEGRVLGLLRFGLDGEDARAPEAPSGCLAFQFNRDADPEIVARGAPPEGRIGLKAGVVVRAHGMLCGVRVLQARVPGAKTSEAVVDLAAPHAHPEGETGLHLKFAPLKLAEGQEAYVAFALEVCEEKAGGGVPGLAGRLSSARVAAEPNLDGWVRLAWGASLSLETSTRVMPFRSWLTPPGEVRTGK